MQKRLLTPAIAASLGARRSYSIKVAKILPSNLIGWWKMADPSGTTCTDSSPLANHGTYTNITLGQAGFDGNTCALIDNATDVISVVTNLAADFNGSAGGFMGWYKVSGVGVWTDGQVRKFARFRVDANNFVYLYKYDAVGLGYVAYEYYAGGTAKTVQWTSTNPTGWFSVGATWDKAADQAKLFINGVKTGATLTGLGVWAGTIAFAELGAGAGGSAWSGNVQHCLMYNVAPSEAQMLALGTSTPG